MVFTTPIGVWCLAAWQCPYAHLGALPTVGAAAYV